jgi:hypothetical protein
MDKRTEATQNNNSSSDKTEQKWTWGRNGELVSLDDADAPDGDMPDDPMDAELFEVPDKKKD